MSTKKIIAGVLVVAFTFAGAAVANAAYTHSVTLKQGSANAQVMALQQTLNATSCKVAVSGAGSPGMETSTFGPRTRAAVVCFQAANGLTADGVVGPMTGAKLGLVVAGPAGNPNQPVGNLNGTDGTISDVNELSQYASEEVGEGEEDIKVLGFEVEASNDGDIQLTSTKVSFTITNASGSDNLDDYIDGMTVWMGDTKIGSADSDDFDEGSAGVWTKTITLSGSVVRADETEKFYITVDGANTLDSGDIDSEVFTADVENLRFKDGSGVVTTETGFDLDGMDVPVAFVSFSAAADTELKISADSDSPEAQIVMIDDDQDTDDVVLLRGKLKLEGSSDVVIDELPITFTGSGAAVASITGNVILKIGGEEYNETMSITVGATTGTVTFDNLDFTIDAGDTEEFEVLADINDIETAAGFDEGDTLTASLTASNRDYIDAENEEGDQLADSGEKTGTATGEAQEFRTEGIDVDLVSTSTSVTAGTSANDDLGTFTIKFKVTAVGNTVYISSLADTALAANDNGSSTIVVDRAGTATVGGTSVALTNLTDTDLNNAGLYEIEDGSSHTFEITTTVQLPTAGAAGLYRAWLKEVSWDTDSTDPTPDEAYTSNMDNFKTSYIGLN